MLVSVIFSTRNRAERLAVTLEGFTRLEVPAAVTWELVVADNGSSDRTAAVIAEWAERLPLRRVWAPDPGLSRGRNAALAAARGELILFTDDDVMVSSGWMAAYVQAYRAHGSDRFFGGPIESVFEGDPPPAPWLRLAPASIKGLYWGAEERPLESGEYFIGPNWACAAEPVRRVGGFNPRMGLGARDGPCGGEELELMERLRVEGLRSWYVPSARLRHWVPASKTGSAHILARWEALAAVQAWKGKTAYRPGRFYRVPWKLYPDMGKALLRRMAAGLGYGDPIEAEARYVWCRGLWTGFRLPPRRPGDLTE